MDCNTLNKIYKEWSEWYNAEMIEKPFTVPRVTSEGEVENIKINEPLVHYCGLDGVKINEYLRTGEYKTKSCNRSFEFSLYATVISFLIETTPRMQEDFAAYRYVSEEELRAIITPYEKNANSDNKKVVPPYQKKDFLSVTLDKNLHTWKDEEYVKTKYMLEIKIPAGSHALYPTLLKSCGRSFEQELILQKGAYLIYNGEHRTENDMEIYSCKLMFPAYYQ